MEEMAYHFVQSSRGKEKLAHQGFIYRHQRSRGENHYYVCERHGCPGRAILRGVAAFNDVGGEVTRSVQHNHAVPEGRDIVLKAVASMAKEGASTTNLPSAIVQSHRQAVPPKYAAGLPSEEALRQRIRRQRRQKFPSEPRALTEIEIPDDLKTTIGDQNRQFLLFDVAEHDERILCFGTVENVKKLSECPQWYLDGTFKTAPRLFRQIYTIHGAVNSTTFPFIYALLPSKTEDRYEALFAELIAIAEENDVDLAPTQIMTDFELASINAIQHCFPNARVTGCLFHLGQSVYRRIQAEGLVEAFRDDDNVRSSLKSLMAGLPFLPPEEIPAVFAELKTNAPHVTGPVFTYFEDTYVLGRPILPKGKGRRPRILRRHPPRYPTTLWSVHHLKQENLPRTNNHMEAWHRRFASVVARMHLGVYPAIHELRKENHRVEHELTRLEAGLPIQRRQSKVNKDREARIDTIFRRYGKISHAEFMRGIAHNFDFDAPREDEEEDGEDEEEDVDDDDLGVFF